MISQCIYDPKRSKVSGACGETLAQLMSVDLLVIRHSRIILAGKTPPKNITASTGLPAPFIYSRQSFEAERVRLPS